MRFVHVMCASLVAGPLVGRSTTLCAQGADRLPVRRFGITAGFNSASFGGKDADDPSQKRLSGMSGGVFAVIPQRPHVAFQPELLVTMKGARFEDATGTGTFTMTYVEVPGLLRFDVPVSGAVKPFLIAGPVVSLKLTCDVETTAPGFSASATCEELQSQTGGNTNFNTIDYGVIGGGGIVFDVAGKTFSVGARYNYSLARIETSSETKHRVISVLATFEFPWGR
jgi:hypothetical protein